MEKELKKENFSEFSIWSAVSSSWTELSIKNREKIDFTKNIKICIVLCPLYKTGNINMSDIISFDQKIDESRVWGKLLAYKNVLTTLVSEIHKIGVSPEVEFIVANKGILLERTPYGSDYSKLEYHNMVYKQLISNWSLNLGFKYKFSDYFDRKVSFPTFVSMKDSIPAEIQASVSEPKSEPFLLIEYINGYLRNKVPIINNADNRHIAKSLIKALGFSGAFWLTAGYVVFDNKIPEILGENGIYLVSERLDPLFSISKFTPSLDRLTRIQIKA